MINEYAKYNHQELFSTGQPLTPENLYNEFVKNMTMKIVAIGKITTAEQQKEKDHLRAKQNDLLEAKRNLHRSKIKIDKKSFSLLIKELTETYESIIGENRYNKNFIRRAISLSFYNYIAMAEYDIRPTNIDFIKIKKIFDQCFPSNTIFLIDLRRIIVEEVPAGLQLTASEKISFNFPMKELEFIS
ncbi:MAG: hypothetical protein V1858_05515 [Candidatus Gottesmanbacteria bacterium]